MKRITLIIAAATTVLASCSKAGQAPETPQPQAIKFEAYTARATRAAETTHATLGANGFNVLALLTKTSGNPAVKYFNEAVTVHGNNADHYWAPANNYYWPAAFSDMTFHAANEAIADGCTIAWTGEQKDLVVASASVNTVPTTAADDICTKEKEGCVHLDFTHALTKVNFSFAGSDMASDLTYTVSSLKVNAVTKGTYAFGATPGWSLSTDSDASSDIEYLNSAQTFVVTTSAIAGNNSMVLIPQVGTVPDGETIGYLDCKIEYKVERKISETETVTIKDFSGASAKTFKIPTTVETVPWASQKSFRYVLTLPVGAQPITFTATVTGWDEEKTADITID